jgi:hypothetical protein
MSLITTVTERLATAEDRDEPRLREAIYDRIAALDLIRLDEVEASLRGRATSSARDILGLIDPAALAIHLAYLDAPVLEVFSGPCKSSSGNWAYRGILGEALSVDRRNWRSHEGVADLPAWPVVGVGARVIIHSRADGWSHHAVVDVVVEAGRLTVTFEGAGVPDPLLVATTDAGERTVRTTTVSGYAHTRQWSPGNIVVVDGAFWRVVSERRPARGVHSSHITYVVEPSTAEAHATRPGRCNLPSSSAESHLGSAVQTPRGEWLHVTRIQRRRYHEDTRDTVAFGVGRYVSRERALAINALHPEHLDRDLDRAARNGERTHMAMPAAAVTVMPPRAHSLVPSGSRALALPGGDAVLYELVGDPDRIDSLHRYVVRIVDAALAKRVRAFAKKKTKAARQ